MLFRGKTLPGHQGCSLAYCASLGPLPLLSFTPSPMSVCPKCLLSLIRTREIPWIVDASLLPPPLPSHSCLSVSLPPLIRIPTTRVRAHRMIQDDLISRWHMGSAHRGLPHGAKKAAPVPSITSSYCTIQEKRKTGFRNVCQREKSLLFPGVSVRAHAPLMSV